MSIAGVAAVAAGDLWPRVQSRVAATAYAMKARHTPKARFAGQTRENGDVGLTDDERDVLEASPHVSIVRISDAGHFTINQQPAEIARLVLEALTSRARR